jgi:hypothetical protein
MIDFNMAPLSVTSLCKNAGGDVLYSMFAQVDHICSNADRHLDDAAVYSHCVVQDVNNCLQQILLLLFGDRLLELASL